MKCANCGVKELSGNQTKYCSESCGIRGWKKSNRDKARNDLLRTAQKRLAVRRQYVTDLKREPCQDCGVEYPPYVMDFDHVRGEKIRSISQCLRYGLDELKREIAKCDLVCSNCHRIRTASRLIKN